MKRRSTSHWLRPSRWVPLIAGGFVLQSLAGCDPEVRDAVLGGFQSSITGLLSSVINAFFLSLQGSGSTSQPVVKAIFHDLPNWLA